MQISQIMTRDIEIASPDDSVQKVARQMLEHDIGFLPVGQGNRLVGMITDRDIATRCVAAGLDGACKVRDVMTNDVKYCFDTDEIDDVAMNMGDIQVRRLAVIDDDKRLCGIVSLADTVREENMATAEGFRDVVRPGGMHN